MVVESSVESKSNGVVADKDVADANVVISDEDEDQDEQVKQGVSPGKGQVEAQVQPSLDIPIRDENEQESDEVIQIFLDDLPPTEELLGVLKAEKADLKLWLQFAVEYYRQNRLKDFESILKEGCSPEVENYYAQDKEGRIAILNAYAAYKIDLGRGKGDNKQRRREKGGKYLTEAQDFLNRADKISNADDKTWVNKGVLQTVRGELEEAEKDFSSALELEPNNLLAILGIASVYFANEKYKAAKDQYKVAIRFVIFASLQLILTLTMLLLETSLVVERLSGSALVYAFMNLENQVRDLFLLSINQTF